MLLSFVAILHGYTRPVRAQRHRRRPALHRQCCLLLKACGEPRLAFVLSMTLTSYDRAALLTNTKLTHTLAYTDATPYPSVLINELELHLPPHHRPALHHPQRPKHGLALVRKWLEES